MQWIFKETMRSLKTYAKKTISPWTVFGRFSVTLTRDTNVIMVTLLLTDVLMVINLLFMVRRHTIVLVTAVGLICHCVG